MNAAKASDKTSTKPTKKTRATAQPAPDLNTPQALTVPEAARALRVSEQTMWRLVLRGEVKSFKIGASRRVPSWGIVEYMEARVSA